jgi:hypothetical protein
MTVAESLGALGERQFRLLYIGRTLSNLGSALSRSPWPSRSWT